MAKKAYEEVIARKLLELDREHAEYQRLHRRFYREEDNNAKLIHELLVDTYESILKEIKYQERKK